MRREDADAAASLLAAAWRGGALLPEIPQSCRPRSAADGYRIQDLFAERLGHDVAGWKIGCTSAVARRILKTRGPFAGRVLAPRVLASGATVPAGAYPMRGIEGEFAFRLGKALPARKRAYSLGEVSAAVASLHPAIEIVDSRFVEWLKVGTPSLIADLGSNGALVLGAAVPRWRNRKLDRQAVTMTVDGKAVGQGTGADCLGHPLKALLWLANTMRGRDGLARGQVISTGTCSGFHRAAPGDRARADFGPLGAVDVEFAA